jgi:hypothetical protein
MKSRSRTLDGFGKAILFYNKWKKFGKQSKIMKAVSSFESWASEEPT